MESHSMDSSIQYIKRDKIIRGGRGRERHLVEMGEEGRKAERIRCGGRLESSPESQENEHKYSPKWRFKAGGTSVKS